MICMTKLCSRTHKVYFSIVQMYVQYSKFIIIIIIIIIKLLNFY
jgi:hypothetical protein